MKLINKTLKALPRMLALLSFLGISLVGVPEAKSQPAGTLLGVAIINGTPTLKIVNPDGTLTDLPVAASFPGFQVAQGVSAFDAITLQYFTVMVDATGTRLLVKINTQTGPVPNPPALSHPLASLEVDPATGTLFGVAIIDGTPTLKVVNPNGTLTDPPVAASFPGSQVAQGVSALDTATDQYFTVMVDATGTRLLVKINTQTGPVPNPPALSHPLASLKVDPAGTLFGVAIIDGTPTLVSVNTGTGALTPVAGASFAGSQAAQGVSALAPNEFFSVIVGTRHLVGINTQTGAFTNPTLSDPLASLEFTAEACVGKADGTACDDGNACTQTDTCQTGVCTGSNPVTCTASDQCHVAGTCDPTTGVCSNPAAPNGTACSDGDACTQTDTCQTGVCTGSNPVTCTASDQCHVAGTCDPTTGVCSNPAAPNGTACSDGDACTQTDTCQTGVCTGSNPVTCTASDQCHVAGTCDPATGVCSNPAAPDGTACNDGNACTQPDTCQAGVCAGQPATVCQTVGAEGGTVTTDTGTGATLDDPVTTTVTIPSGGTGGTVSITETTPTQTPPPGFTFLGQQINITAPSSTADNPLVIVFRLDESQIVGVDPLSIEVFKDGVLVQDCPPGASVASPDPCVSNRVLLTGGAAGDVEITVLTSTASDWNFGASSIKICRSPGFWGTHAGTEKSGSVDITLAIITSAGGSVSVCGETLTDTDLNHAHSAEEALCISTQGNQKLQLARQLTAAKLNCVVNGAAPDCLTLISNCDSVCVNPGASVNDITACIEDLDAFNNGLSDLAPDCDLEPLPGFEPPGPTGSSKKCNDAIKTPCTIIPPGEASCVLD